MRYITDWHIHSRYSRACSKDLELPKIAEWCERKGINIVATGDWMHPKWFAHLEEYLEEVRQGIYRLKGDKGSKNVNDERRRTEFMLVTEVSQIYKKNDKTRRVHNLVWSPSLEVCRKVNAELTKRGFNLKSDGRPILGIDSEDLYALLRSIDERIIVVPAHAWTPWYAVFGSKSGFDSLEECFGAMTPYVYAVETGLSSDPRMNAQWSELDKVMLISNSDAHSPKNLGREANVFQFDVPPTYDDFVLTLKEKDRSKFIETIEFYPEEGKYYADGCSADQYCCSPEESDRMKLRCPVCKKKLTLGVCYRIEKLADRSDHEIDVKLPPFKSIVPLAEILAELYEVKSSSSKKVQQEYFRLTDQVNEFALLLDLSFEEIVKLDSHELLPKTIQNMRSGNVQKTKGYDGIYGKIHLLHIDDLK